MPDMLPSDSAYADEPIASFPLNVQIAKDNKSRQNRVKSSLFMQGLS